MLQPFYTPMLRHFLEISFFIKYYNTNQKGAMRNRILFSFLFLLENLVFSSPKAYTSVEKTMTTERAKRCRQPSASLRYPHPLTRRVRIRDCSTCCESMGYSKPHETPASLLPAPGMLPSRLTHTYAYDIYIYTLAYAWNIIFIADCNCWNE